MRMSLNMPHVLSGEGNLNNHLEYYILFSKKQYFFFLLDRSGEKKYKVEECKNTKCHFRKWEIYLNRDK